MTLSVDYFVGRTRKYVPLLQNYPSLDEPKTEQYFVEETKDGLAHGQGKIYKIGKIVSSYPSLRLRYSNCKCLRSCCHLI